MFIIMRVFSKVFFNRWRSCILSVAVISTIFLCYILSSITDYSKAYIYNQMGNNSLLDLQNFYYIINNNICSGDIFLLILVHSAPNHFHHRNLIRSTWGNPGSDLPTIKIAFLLAAATKFQDDIENENRLYSDIVQGNFLDSYHNLTYKHTMGLMWASKNCAQAKYLMKMDDDIFVDIYEFIHYINSQFMHFDLKNNIACYFQKQMPVVRDPVSKWYVSEEEYKPNVFEDYCSGWAYLTTTNVAEKLYQTAKKLSYFWVDDVHITGTAAKIAKVGLITINNLFALEADGLVDWSSNSVNIKWDKVFAPTWGDLVLSRKAHGKALKCYISKCKCCYTKPATIKPQQVSTTVKGIAKLLSLSLNRS